MAFEFVATYSPYTRKYLYRVPNLLQLRVRSYVPSANNNITRTELN